MRGETTATTTGMGTEIGHIAEMLNETEVEKTPLQKQLDKLTVVIAAIAGVAFLVMLLIGVSNDDPFDEIFTAGIAVDRSDPVRPASGGHHDVLRGHPGTRRPGSDRQAVAVGGDARLRCRRSGRTRPGR